MELIADGLLIAGALTAALYCWVLSRRLNALKRMDRGLGGAIAGLSARVEQTKASLADTKTSTGELTRELTALTARAEIAAGRLELLLASMQERQSAERSAAKPTPAPEPEMTELEEDAEDDGRVDLAPTIRGGLVFAGTRNGYVYAINRETGPS